MSKCEIGIFGCRMLSLYALVHAVMQLKEYFQFMGTWVRMGMVFSSFPKAAKESFLTPEMALFSALPPALMLLLSAWLWFGASKLSQKMFAGALNVETPVETSFTGRDIQFLGFTAMNWLILIYTLPQVGQIAYATYSASINAAKTPKQAEQTQVWILVQCAAVVLQLCLAVSADMKAKCLKNS